MFVRKTFKNGTSYSYFENKKCIKRLGRCHLVKAQKTIHIREKSCAHCKEKIEEDHKQRLMCSTACLQM